MRYILETISQLKPSLIQSYFYLQGKQFISLIIFTVILKLFFTNFRHFMEPLSDLAGKRIEHLAKKLERDNPGNPKSD